MIWFLISGNSASGDFCYSLNLTDIHTGRTETRAVLGKNQEAKRAGLEGIRQALTFRLRGIDSDNGSEFINDHLFRYCETRAIQFTPGRPYKKNDNAHIEQKNWTHVRRLLGYVRYDRAAARETMNDLYRNEVRVFQNLFLLSGEAGEEGACGSALAATLRGAPEGAAACLGIAHGRGRACGRTAEVAANLRSLSVLRHRASGAGKDLPAQLGHAYYAT